MGICEGNKQEKSIKFMFIVQYNEISTESQLYLNSISESLNGTLTIIKHSNKYCQDSHLKIVIVNLFPLDLCYISFSFHSQSLPFFLLISFTCFLFISPLSLYDLNTFINMPTNQVKNKLQLSVNFTVSYSRPYQMTTRTHWAPLGNSSSLPRTLTLQLKLKLQRSAYSIALLR